jgi:ATP-dependent exoDNAse (exonuclease V) beta subunit
MNKSAFHPSGKQILFDEPSHTYTVDGEKYTSVTTVIHEFFPEFDSELQAKNYARKWKLDKDEVLAEWAAINHEACERGSNIHLYCENLLLGKELPDPYNEKAAECFPVAERFINELLKRYTLIDSEKIVFSPRYKISGTVDLLMRHKKTDQIIMMDWKTNKKIELNTNYNQYGLGKLRHLPDCNFSHYSLQLNLYTHLLELEGYFDKIDRMRILHIADGKIIPYNIERMTREIGIILAQT